MESAVTAIGSFIAPIGDVLVNNWDVDIMPATVDLTITGLNFGTNAAYIRVYLTSSGNNSVLSTSVTSASITSLDVALYGLASQHVGPLQAMVAVNGALSQLAQVAVVQHAPTIVPGDAPIAQSGAGNRIEIHGEHFGTDPTAVTATLNPVLSVVVIACTGTRIVLDVGDTSGISVGTDILAGVHIGLPTADAPPMVKIGSVSAALGGAPDITQSTTELSYMAETLIIAGQNLGTSTVGVLVYLTAAAGLSPTASVASASGTEIGIVLRGISAKNLGGLRAVVTVSGVKTPERVVTTIAELLPVVSKAHPLHGPVEGNTLVALEGTSFQLFRTGTLLCVWDTVTPDGGLGNITGWDSATTPASFANSSTVLCKTPRFDAGKARLSIRYKASGIQYTPVTHFTTPSTIQFEFIPSILIADSVEHRVCRFHSETGSYIDTFVTPRSGGLYMPWGMAFGPDKNFYVSSGGTFEILQYHGQTGAFQSVFCRVKGSPRGITFHYGDLYVVSSQDQSVYRYNGITGSLMGTYCDGLQRSGIMKLPWGIKFEAATNHTYLSSEQTHSIVRFKPPSLVGSSSLAVGAAVHRSDFDRIWTQHPLRLITGFDFTEECVYAVSPMSQIIVQYNRTTGQQISHFSDNDLHRPTDIYALGSHLYVCSQDSVRVYHQATSEYLLRHIHMQGMHCSSMIRHANWDVAVGFQ